MTWSGPNLRWRAPNASIEIMRTEEDECISGKPCQETGEAAATWRRQQPRPQEQHQQKQQRHQQVQLRQETKLLEAHFFSREGRVLGACLNTFERSESSCECLTVYHTPAAMGWDFIYGKECSQTLPDSCGTLTLHEQLAVV